MKRLAMYALLASWAFSGCVCVGDDRGDLTLLYTFDGALCSTAGVRDIRVIVEGVDVSDGSDQLVSCFDFPEGIVIEDLREGEYAVELRGIGPDGTALYVLFDTRVVVHGGADNVYDLDVPPRLGDLEVYWTFDGSTRCGSVFDVRVTLVDPTGLVFDDSLYRCDVSGVIYDAVLAGEWIVSLDGLDAGGSILYTARNVPLFVEPGQTNPWTVDLR